MLKHEKLPSTSSTKSGAHLNCAKFQENEHTPAVYYATNIANVDCDCDSFLWGE